MNAGKLKPVQKALWQQARPENTLLHENALRCMESALKQVERSRRLVSKSHEIIANLRKSLERSSRIRHGMAGRASKNPLIPGRDISRRKLK